jgi:hypothetical protein
MKLPNNLGLKAYIILFAIFAWGSFTALITPDGGTHIYYNTFLRLHNLAIIWFIFAILDSLLGILTVIPLLLRAFEKPLICPRVIRHLFILRLFMIIPGHNYEWVVLKSTFIGTPTVGWITLGVWALFTFPSFKEHFVYAFRSKE